MKGWTPDWITDRALSIGLEIPPDGEYVERSKVEAYTPRADDFTARLDALAQQVAQYGEMLAVAQATCERLAKENEWLRLVGPDHVDRAKYNDLDWEAQSLRAEVAVLTQALSRLRARRRHRPAAKTWAQALNATRTWFARLQASVEHYEYRGPGGNGQRTGKFRWPMNVQAWDEVAAAALQYVVRVRDLQAAGYGHQRGVRGRDARKRLAGKRAVVHRT